MEQSFSDFLKKYQQDNQVKKVPDFYKELGTYLSPSFILNEEELELFLIAYINMIKKTSEPFDKTEACKIINDDSVIKNCIRAIENGWHTHNLKIPNAQVKCITGILADKTIISNPAIYPAFFCGQNQTIDKQYGVVGDAARTSQAKLMALELILASEKVCVAEQLIIDDSLIQQAFVSIGITVENLKRLQAAIKAKLKQPRRENIDTNNKQILFPIGNGQYHSLTPCQNTGLARIYVNTLKQQDLQENVFIKRRGLKIGGTNAINAGVLNVEIGGLHRHLLAIPPTNIIQSKKLKNLINRIHYAGSLLVNRNIDFKILDAIRQDTTNNRRIRLQRRGILQAYLNYILEPITFLNEYFSQNPELLINHKQLTKLTDLELKLLSGNVLNEIQKQTWQQRIENHFFNLKLPEKMASLNQTEADEFKDLVSQYIQEL